MSKVYFGIDLGTSSSSISYLVEGRNSSHRTYIEPVTIKFNPHAGATLFHNWQRLPSVVYIEHRQNSKKVITGFEALEEAAGKRAKPFENLFVSVKSDMGTLKIYEDSVHPEIISPVEVSAEIIKKLIRVAEKETGISPKKSHVVITVPASFAHNQREDTIKAARLAGLTLDDGGLLDEPVAAFIHTACHQKLDSNLDMKRPRKTVMFDLGAGTCDISVFEASYDADAVSNGIGLNIKNRSISNYEKLGGDNIDLHIVEAEILPLYCEKNSIDFGSLPEKVKRELRFRLKITAKSLKESICMMISGGRGRTCKQQWSVDAFHISALDIKTRKISGTTSAERFLELMKPFVSYNFDGSCRIADDYFIYSFFGPVFNALDKANLSPEAIDAFIFNGGSCHNPIIRRAFETFDSFRNARFFDAPDLDLSVSKGAAIQCYYLHKNERPVVIPIVNDEIGIFTLGLKREKLLAAGTELPFPGNGDFSVNDNFCIPKDNLESVGISIYSGNGKVISNLKLSLPEGIKKGEPVSIGLHIDRNKVMKFTAGLVYKPDIKIDAELSHPWTHNINTPEDIAAGELWKKAAEMKKGRQKADPELMIELSNRERLRGNTGAAVEIIERLQDKGINTAGLNNIVALCYEDRGEEEKALEYFRKAFEMAPDNVIYATNYGCQLADCGKIDEGISRLRQALDIDSEHYAAYYWLGQAYRKSGNEAQAIKEYKMARQILRRLCSQYPQTERYLDFLEGANRALGDYEDAQIAGKKLRDLKNSKVLNVSPDRLIAGPESGIWEEESLREKE
ncbi:MAG: Hsp70 family protein [Nitrospirae bacterium]|nr:Hsp70 family protein [Nitrospirota bacterium]